LTSVSRKKMISRNSARARLLITSRASAPMLRALWRTEIASEPKSWTPAAKMVPATIHTKAGPHPQNTAIAGPTIGAAPATDVNWWPNSTCLLVGT
jgi:muramidase (phage lysozyme)